MQKTVFEFKKVYEHDMDLLIIEEFISDRGFARIFLDKLKLSDGYVIPKVFHSLSDSDGESDITIIIQYPDKRVALLIEDKIDAQTMPGQSDRYYKRAKKAVERGEYDDFYVVLAAPSEYHMEHADDPNAVYEHRVSYEEMRKYLQEQNSLRAAYKLAVIDCAIREKKTGYLVQEAPAVTEFWIKMRRFCNEHYPNLKMLGEDAPKGAAASWPEFRTSLGTIKVVYKSQKGFVDLEFPQYGDRTADLYAILRGKMTENMQIWKTGKSASVRIADDRWAVDFSQNFDENVDIVKEVLNAVSGLCEFASSINYSELY